MAFALAALLMFGAIGSLIDEPTYSYGGFGDRIGEPEPPPIWESCGSVLRPHRSTASPADERSLCLELRANERTRALVLASSALVLASSALVLVGIAIVVSLRSRRKTPTVSEPAAPQ